MPDVTASALEAMQNAKGVQGTVPEQPAPQQATQQTQAGPLIPPQVLVRAFQEIDTADAARQRTINKQLVVAQLPPNERQGAEALLELHEAATTIKREREALDLEQYNNLVLKVANEYTQYGVGPAMLVGLNETQMRALGEHFKTAKGGTPESGEGSDGESTPGIMNEKPSVGASGQVAQAKVIEKYRGKGLASLEDYITDLYA